MMRLFAALLLAALTTHSAFAQTHPAPIDSHQVNPDGSITFRLLAPGAKAAAVALDIAARPLAMAQDEHGLWSVTTPPLPPEFYGYNLVVDGRTQLDPLNPDVRFNFQSLTDEVLVPGHPAEPWELQPIAHGSVDHHTFTSQIALHLPSGQSGFVVYTPPGYDRARKGGYPVLYLLHGWSDNETGWDAVGRASNILDALIDSGKAAPMIVVMPLGYGDLDFVTGSFSVWNDAAKVSANVRLFSQSLRKEVMPAVEAGYNTAPGRENRAIAGLSMGGLESLLIGLNDPQQFAWIGGMSSAIMGLPPSDANPAGFDRFFPLLLSPDAVKKADFRLLWVACGTGDRLIAPNRAFVAWAKAKGLAPVAVETPGLHVWEVWRDNLIHLAPLLFQPH